MYTLWRIYNKIYNEINKSDNVLYLYNLDCLIFQKLCEI